MTLLIQGGPANSGCKRPLKEAPKIPWTCSRDHENPRYASRCLTLGCNEERKP